MRQTQIESRVKRIIFFASLATVQRVNDKWHSTVPTPLECRFVCCYISLDCQIELFTQFALQIERMEQSYELNELSRSLFIEMVEYSLLLISRQRSIAIQICLLIVICITSSVAVYSTWTAIYQRHLNIPPKLIGKMRGQPGHRNAKKSQIISNISRYSTILDRPSDEICQQYNV